MPKIELQKVAVRDRLKPRREPYWWHLEAGQALGYRKMTADSVGYWSARFYDPATCKKIYRALGSFDGLPPSDRFAAAKAAAVEWLQQVAHGGRSTIVTVRDACHAYAEHVASTKGNAPAEALRANYRRWIDPDKVAAVDLVKLRREHVRAWRARMEATPTASGSIRAAASVSRDMTSLRSALNWAMAEGAVSSDFAWSEPLRPAPGSDNRRTVYLSPEQRRALIDAADPEVRPLLKVLCALPLRPGAAAALLVADFDRAQGTLKIRRDKAGQGRTIKLPPQAAALLAECARDKLPGAPLISRADGRAWDKDAWKKPIKAAVMAAGLPKDAVAYSLRHATITDLVSNGLDVASTAALAGTSIVMIQRHYSHLQQDRAAAALAGLAL